MRCLPSCALNGGIYACFGSTKQQGGRSRFLAASEALEWMVIYPPASSLVLRSTSRRGWRARSTQDLWQESDEIKHNTKKNSSKNEELPLHKQWLRKGYKLQWHTDFEISPSRSLPAWVKHNTQWQRGWIPPLQLLTNPNETQKSNNFVYRTHHRNGCLPKSVLQSIDTYPKRSLSMGYQVHFRYRYSDKGPQPSLPR